MKTKAILKFIFLIEAIILILSCDLSDTSKKISTGSLVLNIQNIEPNKRSRNVHSWPDQISNYEAIGKGPNGATFAVSWSAGDSCTVDSLESGSWFIQVNAANKDSALLMSGSDNITVLSGKEISATIRLSYIPGNGAVAFKITWPTEVEISSGTVSMDSSTHSFDIDMIYRIAEYTYVSVTAGMDHSFSLELLDSMGDRVYGTAGTVHVTNGFETPVIIDFANNLAPPSRPENTHVATGRFCVDLNWTDSEGETGYIIEYRFDGETEWQLSDIVNENVTSYRDIKAKASSNYEYRIVAYNDTAETAGEVVNISTPQFSEIIVKSSVAFGPSNGYRIMEDGRVMGYGLNDDGQLGSRANAYEPSGVIIDGLSNIISIKSNSNGNNNLAIDSEGRLWRFGIFDDDGPRKVTGIDRQIIDADLSMSCYYAIDADGKVWVWGYNFYGQLGNGTTHNISEPAINDYYPETVAIESGGSHVLALAKSGKVYVCGSNFMGQLGLGDTTDRTIPEEVSGISGVIAVRALPIGNSWCSFLIMNDGSVMAAGYSLSKEFGLPDKQYNVFTTIPGLTDIVDINNTYASTIALDRYGNLYGAGSDTGGTLLELGDIEEFTAMATAPSSITYLYTGMYKVYCEDSSGGRYAWGRNTSGELMTGKASVNVWPIENTLPATFTSIVGGTNHYVAIDLDGDVWAWGNNQCGQLGDGTIINRALPVKIFSNTSDAIQVIANGNYSKLLLEDGSIYGWGNSYKTEGTTPELIDFPVIATGVVEIAMGSSHTLARKNDGTVWAWGNNYYSQLGDGTERSHHKDAVQVLSPDGINPLTGVVKIYASGYYSNALLNDGTLLSWGSDTLGAGIDIEETAIPVKVLNITNAQDFYVGKYTAICIETNGTIWKWGTLHSCNDAIPIDYMESYGNPGQGIKKIVFGRNGVSARAMFLLDDGTIRIKGDYLEYGVPGTGVIEILFPDEFSWIQPIGPNQIIDIATTDNSCAALSSSGTLWTWGMNDFGQAADGTIVPNDNFTPIKLPW